MDEVSIDTIGVPVSAGAPWKPKRTIPVDQRFALSAVFHAMTGAPLRPRPGFDGCGFMAGSCSCTTRCQVVAS